MKKIIVTGIILFIIGLAGASVLVYKNIGLEKEAPFKHQKQTEANATKKVIVKSKSVDIEVYQSQNNQISAIFSGSKRKNITTDLQLSNQGDTVIIEAKREENLTSWIHFDWGTIKQPTKVAVYLPKKQYESLALQTSHGDIKLEDFQGNTVKANTNNGDVKFQNVNAVMTVQSSHGDITLSDIAFHDNNSVTTSSGDIHVQTTSHFNDSKKLSQAQLILQTSFGNIDLNGYQGSMLKANTSSGDVNLQNIDTAFTTESENGDINIKSIQNFYAKNKAITSNGDINISVGHDLKSLNADFTGSDVQSDFPIQTKGTTSTSTDDYVNRQLKGVIGTSDANSPSLTLQTHNGDVSFSK